jgi:hypothetical protein
MPIRNRTSTLLRTVRDGIRSGYDTQRTAINADLVTEGVTTYTIPTIDSDNIEISVQGPQCPESDLLPGVRIAYVGGDETLTSVGRLGDVIQQVEISAFLDIESLASDVDSLSDVQIESVLVQGAHDTIKAIRLALTPITGPLIGTAGVEDIESINDTQIAFDVDSDGVIFAVRAISQLNIRQEIAFQR